MVGLVLRLRMIGGVNKKKALADIARELDKGGLQMKRKGRKRYMGDEYPTSQITCGFRRNADTDSDPLRTAFR